jgi:signal transduction histidine kinase
MRLLAQILFLTILPLLIVLSYNYYQNVQLEQILNKQLQHRIETLTGEIQKELQNKKIATQQVNKLIAKSQLIINAFEKRDVDFLYTRANMFTLSNIIAEMIFIDKKGTVLSRASDEFRFNDSIQGTDLETLLLSTEKYHIVYFDNKYQLINIQAIYKYDINLLGYVISSQIIDKKFLNLLTTDNFYLEFHKDNTYINNFDEQFENMFDQFTKISISDYFSVYINFYDRRQAILENKTKQTYIIVFLLILSTVFIFIVVGRILKPFNKLNKLLLEFASQKIGLDELIYKINRHKNRYNELAEIQQSISLTLEKLQTTQNALIDSNEKTIHANQLKDKFLSNMSHKIRTPMNEIISFLELLGKTDLSSKQDKFLKKAFLSTESLSEVINNILDIAKIESGEFELNVHFISLSKVIKNINKRYKELASNKNIDFMMKVDNNISSYQFYLDQIRLQQAIENILDNAIYFTHSGLVQIDLKIENIDKETLDLVVSVYDTGIGIKKAYFDKIFDSFTTYVENENNTSHPGAGLGLSISKQIITRMGGEIKVSSKINKGSTFTLSLSNIKYK